MRVYLSESHSNVATRVSPLRADIAIAQFRCGMRNAEIKLQSSHPVGRNRAYLSVRDGDWSKEFAPARLFTKLIVGVPEQFERLDHARRSRHIGLQSAVQTAAAFEYQARST